ncbi:MAG: hypothetical protein PHZ28_06300 [Candidatus Izemoplasmatales bacterium]|nr:hypothetical protein [Candidatus Izemoplasmatales bacterium]
MFEKKDLKEADYILVETSSKGERKVLLDWLVHNRYELISNSLYYYESALTIGVPVRHLVGSTIRVIGYDQKNEELNYGAKLYDNAFSFMVEMEDDRWPLKNGGECFLVYYETEKERNRVIKDLGNDGFVKITNTGYWLGCPWLFINIDTKVYTPGRAGVGFAKPIGNHAITVEEFYIIYNIYRKYQSHNLFDFNI